MNAGVRFFQIVLQSAVCALLAVACQRDAYLVPETPLGKKTEVLSLHFGDESDTKASIDGFSGRLRWQEGDSIGFILYSEKNQRHYLKVCDVEYEEGGARGFTTLSLFGDEVRRFFAFYPATLPGIKNEFYGPYLRDHFYLGAPYYDYYDLNIRKDGKYSLSYFDYDYYHMILPRFYPYKSRSRWTGENSLSPMMAFSCPEQWDWYAESNHSSFYDLKGNEVTVDHMKQRLDFFHLTGLLNLTIEDIPMGTNYLLISFGDDTHDELPVSGEFKVQDPAWMLYEYCRFYADYVYTQSFKKHLPYIQYPPESNNYYLYGYQYFEGPLVFQISDLEYGIDREESITINIPVPVYAGYSKLRIRAVQSNVLPTYWGDPYFNSIADVHFTDLNFGFARGQGRKVRLSLKGYFYMRADMSQELVRPDELDDNWN